MIGITKSRSRWVIFAAATLVIASYSTPVASQDDGDGEISEDEALVLEEIIVTGTRIKRRDFDSPSPLVTISSEDLDFSGQPTLEEYLNQLPQIQPFSGRTINNGPAGAGINLRGLGPGRTLALLNGRRVAPSGTGSAIDLNNVPSALVQRVEIITGGASTIYGSDAIAGVVNFITRDDFSGLSIEADYNITSESDANIWDFNVVYGLDLSNGGNITFYGGRYERDELFAGEREISSVVWNDDWQSGELQESGSSIIPGTRIAGPLADLGNGPVSVTWDPNGIPREFVRPDDLYNWAPINYLQTPLSRDTFGVLGAVPISNLWEGYFEASYARNEHVSALAEATYFDFVAVNVDNPVLTPETQAVFAQPQFEIGPGLAGMFLLKRLRELGPRIIAGNKEYRRVVAGVRGMFDNGWELDTWVTYTDADEEEVYSNTGSLSRIRQGLLVDPATGQCFDPSGGCVPVNLFGEGNISQEALDYIRVDNARNTITRSQWLASAVLTGSPFEIWSGPVQMAFGAEWRSDEMQFSSDDIFFSGDAIGLRGDAPIDGTESVYELYSEAVLTLFEGRSSSQKLELELGGRWSHYDLAGSVETWKLGFNWRLNDSLRFRTMYQHAVRAPNNEELFRAQFSEVGTFVGTFSVDPCSASQDPVGRGNVEKCILQGLPESQIGVFEAEPFYPAEVILGGNPDLIPEASDTFTFGAVITPESLPGLNLTVDYWNLEVEDIIGGVDPGFVCFNSANTAGVFCENLKRDSSGNVSQIIALVQNRGLVSTDGIDLQVNYSTDLSERWSLFGDDAQFSVSLGLSHTISYDLQENIATDTLDCLGTFGWPCSTLEIGGTHPENRLLSQFSYRSGPLTTQLSWQWVEGTDNAAPLGSVDCCGVEDPLLAVPSIGSWSYIDLGASYEWDNGLLVRLGINNLLDKEPPNLGEQGFTLNTDGTMYDPFGRTYYLNMRYDFGF